MTQIPDTEHYRTREIQERESARTAPDIGIAAIHLDLAERYAGKLAAASVVLAIPA